MSETLEQALVALDRKADELAAAIARLRETVNHNQEKKK